MPAPLGRGRSRGPSVRRDGAGWGVLLSWRVAIRRVGGLSAAAGRAAASPSAAGAPRCPRRRFRGQAAPAALPLFASAAYVQGAASSRLTGRRLVGDLAARSGARRALRRANAGFWPISLRFTLTGRPSSATAAQEAGVSPGRVCPATPASLDGCVKRGEIGQKFRGWRRASRLAAGERAACPPAGRAPCHTRPPRSPAPATRRASRSLAPPPPARGRLYGASVEKRVWLALAGVGC